MQNYRLNILMTYLSSLTIILNNQDEFGKSFTFSRCERVCDAIEKELNIEGEGAKH